MKIVIAADHYGAELASRIKEFLKGRGIQLENIGSKTESEKFALQDLIPKLVGRVSEDTHGILICGTGVGVEIGANRFKGIRASLCTNVETAKFARQYDNANVLCLSSWQTENPDEILEAWLSTEYDGDAKRLEMFKAFDRWAK